MSCVKQAGLGPFNYNPGIVGATDCFLMKKVNLSFAGSFSNTTVTFTLDRILHPTHIAPVAPYTFSSARSLSEFAEVSEIVQIGQNNTNNTRTFRVYVTVPTDVGFVDANRNTFIARGHVVLTVEITTHYTYEGLCSAGKAIALVCFRTVSGVYVNPNTFQLVISGTLRILFVCPTLLRIRHEGECSFLPEPRERVTVT